MQVFTIDLKTNTSTLRTSSSQSFTTEHLQPSVQLSPTLLTEFQAFLITTIAWTGSTQSLTRVQFSGSLTLHIDAENIKEGETIVLLSYQSQEGQFDNVIIESGTCNVEGTTTVEKTRLIFKVEIVDCGTTLFGTRNTIINF